MISFELKKLLRKQNIIIVLIFSILITLFVHFRSLSLTEPEYPPVSLTSLTGILNRYLDEVFYDDINEEDKLTIIDIRMKKREYSKKIRCKLAFRREQENFRVA